MSPIEHPFSDAPGLFDEIMAAVQAKNQSSAYLRFVLN
jgi:hypothetical protein